MIETKALTKSYKRKNALSDLNLRLPRGSVCGFLGPNGAGKTTTLRLLMGLIPPTSGNARVLGLDPLRDSIQLRHRVGYVPDVSHVYHWMTIGEVFRFCAGIFQNWDSNICRKLIDRFALPIPRTVKQLSRGELAKLNLIIALSHKPELLILDEPTTGLDPIARAEFLDAVAELAAGHATTVLFSTHILTDVDRIADRLVIMRDGRALADDSVNALRSRYTKVSFLFAEPPAANLQIPSARRLQKGIREWVAIFDVAAGIDLRATANAIGARDFLPLSITVEDIFVQLFDRPPTPSNGK